MLFTRKKQCRLIVILIIFVLTNLLPIQSTTTKFRSSNIEIKPSSIIIDSTGITDLICINHDLTGGRLEVNLSKLIPSDQIKISTNLLNKTTMNIQLESNNYIGTFYLFCFSNGELSKGNRAEVIVKAAPGVLQRSDERCQVYDRQYIKCIIRAPNIATAIQNGYPPIFKFNEITHPFDPPAYIQPFEFLKNESTNQYLVIKWRPTIEGKFPNGVLMNMTQMLPHFDVSSYIFDMTPVFRVQPKFILKALSSSEIQINLTSISPPAFCKKSIVSRLTSNISQTWTVIEPERNSIVVPDLLSDSLYSVCIKCRQTYTDPDGLEECKEIKTLKIIGQSTVYIIAISILIMVVLVIIGFRFHLWYKRRQSPYKRVELKDERIQRVTNLNRYDLHPPPITASNVSIDTEDQPSAPVEDPNDPDNDDPINDGNQKDYISIASMRSVIDASFPQTLSPSQN